MKTSTPLKIFLSLALVLGLSGCWQVDLEIPVKTGITIVKGNESLYKANATLYGELLEPFRFEDVIDDEESIESFHLDAFYLQLRDTARDSETDLDDLDFVQELVVSIRPIDKACHLKPREIAWFDRTVDDATPEELIFEVDAELELKPYLDCGFEILTDMVGKVPKDDVAVEGLAIFVTASN